VSDPAAAAPRPASRRRRGRLATVALSLVASGFEALLLALALGGFAALAAHPRALALVAIGAVSGAILALRRPVRDQDVASTSPESRWALAGLGLVPLFTPPIAALGERLGIAALPGGAWLRWAGVAMVAAGLALRIAAMTQLGPRFSPMLAVQRQHPLETRGLYARVRHPGYLGSWLAALGAVLAFGSALGLVPLAIFTGLVAGRTRREERWLEQQFGDAYRDYRARTGAFLPRLVPARRG
jgi:protein-S-isoprenylcysteine O-methyltransferase Ste14